MNAGTVPWRGGDTYRGLLLGAAAVLGVLLLVFLLRSMGVAGEGAASLAPLFVLEGLLVAVAWRFSIGRRGLGWSALGLRFALTRRNAVLLSLALAGSLLFTALYVVLVTSVGLSKLLPPSIPEEILEMRGLARVAAVALIVFWAPVSEEVFYRGFLFQGLAASMGGVGGAAASALVFSVSHGALGLLAPVFVSGLLLAWLFRRTGSLVPCVTAHALQNAIAFTAASQLV